MREYGRQGYLVQYLVVTNFLDRGKQMKKLSAISVAIIMSMSILFIGSSSVKAASANGSVQIVPTTKRVSHKVYRKGRWVTKTTYRHGKKITKKVWVKGNSVGHKVGHKTHDVVMGPKHPRP
jgi:hypothetical protein